MKTGLKRVKLFSMIKCIISEFYPPKSLFMPEPETVGTIKVGSHLYSESEFQDYLRTQPEISQEAFVKSQSRYDGKRS